MHEEPETESLQPEEFGTGLRAHLEQSRNGPLEPEEPVAGPMLDAKRAEQELDADAAALEERRRELQERREAIATAEAMLRQREQRLAAVRAELEEDERRLAARRAALDAAAQEPEPVAVEGKGARQLLRERVEREVELLWHAFEEGLSATTPDGRPDVEARLAAARGLLTEAYAGNLPPSLDGDQAGEVSIHDELARLRERKREHQTVP